MSTGRLIKKHTTAAGVASAHKSQVSKQDSSEREEFLGMDYGHPHVQSHELLEQDNPLEFSHHVGSDGCDVKSPRQFGVNTNNSNESVPIRSVHDISASQQSHNYEFLYDSELAKQGANGSIASVKFSGSSQSMAAQSAALSPQTHVFMLSTEGNDNQMRNNMSAALENASSGAGNHHKTSVNSGMSRGSKQGNALSSAYSHLRQSSNSENIAPSEYPQVSITKYNDQRAVVSQQPMAIHQEYQEPAGDGQEEQYIEEEYYIEEEVEESAEEEDARTYNESSHCVETIKEVSSGQENQSYHDSEANKNLEIAEAMGTIQQPMTLSASKQSARNKNIEAHGAQYSHGIKRNGSSSDFNEYQNKRMGVSLENPYLSHSSSKATDSNMASLVFRPRDSDVGAQMPYKQASISVASSNKIQDALNDHKSVKKRNNFIIQSGGNQELQQNFSHPSFGPSNTSKLNQALKWENMAEKCVLRLLLQNLHIQLSKVQDVCQRKLVQQEVILGSLSQMQLKSILDISLSDSFSLHQHQLSGNPEERDSALRELKSKSFTQIQQEVSFITEKLAERLGEYFRGESDILKTLAQERERNQFLEQELLSAREDRVRQVQQLDRADQEGSEDQDLAATEQFITELETNLQQARAELLSSKLQLSDQNVEIANLKNRLNAQSNQINQILEERRNYEESFDNLRSQLEVLQSEKLELSQMVRERENSLQPVYFQNAMLTNSNSMQAENATYQQHQQAVQQFGGVGPSLSNNFNRSDDEVGINRDELQRQIEALNQQVFDANKRQESLERVETNLIEKLDRKELENLELKEGIREMKHENEMKAEVIAKAQKIIERMTCKSQSDENVLQRLSDENDGYKREIGEKQKVINLLNEQLGQVTAKQSHDQVKMQETMAKELEDVRNAMREYQEELLSEKQNYMAQVTSLETQLNATQEERELFANQTSRKEEQARAKLAGAEAEIQHLTQRLSKQEDLTSEMRQELKKQVDLVEGNAKNQINYLQNRIREIVEETQESTNRFDQSTGIATKSTQQLLKGGNPSLIITLRKELESLGQEVLALRETLRNESERSDAMVNQKLVKFDEFRLSVLDQVILWDEKTAELAFLADRYSGALEEQRKLFNKLKVVVKEKDQVIVELNRQLVMREQSQQEHFEEMKAEMISQNRLMQDEMLGTVALLEQKALLKEKQCLELEEAKISSRKEFASLLEERNFFEQELNKVNDRLKFQEAELERLHASQKKQSDVYSEILNVRSMHISQNTIEHALRNLADDCRRYSSEMVAYRDKYHSLERDRDEERKLLNQKVASLEEQYASLQKHAIDKEEEAQLQFVERENELIRDLEKAQAYADKTESELQTRERQLKKIQDKLADDDQKFTDAEAKIEIVAQEKLEALSQVNQLKLTIQEMEGQLGSLENRLKQSEDLVNTVRADRDVERQNVAERDEIISGLETQIQNCGLDLEAQKLRYRELENKLRQVEQRSMQTSKDLQEVYEELTQAKCAKSEIESNNSGLLVDIQGLKAQLESRKAELDEKDVEIKRYQNTVMRQTRELESSHGQAEVIEEQRKRLANFDETMQKQVETIEKLKRDLLKPATSVVQTQTVDSGMLELQHARQEVIKSQQCQEIVYQENVQLKEAMQRSTYEICRLIEDKRELEEMIEKLNKSVSYGGNQSVARGGHYNTTIDASNLGNEMMSKVLNEKENYIGNLENEITEMRKEIEIQREQLLQAEAYTIGAETNNDAKSAYMSLGGHGNGSFFQPYNDVPLGTSSPKYMTNRGFNGFISLANGGLPVNQHAPLRSTSGERNTQHPSQFIGAANDASMQQEIPFKLQAQTLGYSTISRSLTPLEQGMTSSGGEPSDNHSKSGYFQNMNSSMNLINNQTAASNINLTNHNSSMQGAGGPGNASYLNAGNQSSVLMMPNYVSAMGLNTSMLTNDKSNAQYRQLQSSVLYPSTHSAQKNKRQKSVTPGKESSSYGHHRESHYMINV